jgi:Putative phage abortive infection protein
MKWIMWTVASVIFLLIPILAMKWLFHHYGFPTTATDFGNACGFATAIVSGLALPALIFTIKQTQDQIREGQEQFEDQQEQLKENTKALESQKIQLARQVDVMVRESFDVKFFQLLGLLQSIIETLELPPSFNRIARARTVFKALYNQFKGDANQLATPQPGSTPADDDPNVRRKMISDSYGKFHKGFSNELGHYFRTLYHVILYVDRAELEDAEKRNYIRLVRAQLSQHQLLMLFYNGLTDGLGYPKFFPLIKKYDLLQNLGETELIAVGDLTLYQKLNPQTATNRVN